MSTIYFLPNIFTTANLFCGFYALVSILSGDYTKGAIAIVIAGIFDLFDGKLARATNSLSKFGVEYDSLADLISFGIAPSILSYLYMLRNFGRIGWLVSFLYLACAALRLARFNVQSKSIEKKYFQGLPTPVASGFVAGAVLMLEELALHRSYAKMISHGMLFSTLSLALLMVSQIRYRSFKELGLRERKSFGLLVVSVVSLIIVMLRPEMMLFPIAFLYVAVGLIAHVFWLFQRKEVETSPEQSSAIATKRKLILFPIRQKKGNIR